MAFSDLSGLNPSFRNGVWQKAQGSDLQFFSFFIPGFSTISFSNFALGPVAILIRRVHPMNFDVSCFVRVFIRGDKGDGDVGKPKR